MLLKDAAVLLVDDERDLLDIMAEWFKREGSRVLLAEHGAQALRLLAANPVDLIISDIRMPVMDGVSMLQNIKSAQLHKPSVIFISSFTDIPVRQAYDLGVEPLMSKPVERKQLISAVARILADRGELWALPFAGRAEALLDAAFDNLATALRQGLLAFGCGGFCIHSTLELGEVPVDLRLDFAADGRRVTGHGIVRWTAPAESLAGVEILDIDDNNRAWILALTQANPFQSFIPRTTLAQISQAKSAQT